MTEEQQGAEEIGVGTVVRTHKWGGEPSGTVVDRKGDMLRIAWHNIIDVLPGDLRQVNELMQGSFVEDDLPVGEVEVWADAPQALRDWRGGVGVWNPRTWSIEPVRSPNPEPGR